MTLLERAAKAAYLQMISQMGPKWAEAVKVHSWENQTPECRDDWIACVKAAFREAGITVVPDADRLNFEGNEIVWFSVPEVAEVFEPEADTPLEVEAKR